MFFVNKDNIEEFLNRITIAIFLDHHSDDVMFDEYVGRFHFRGVIRNNNISRDNGVQDIYLFYIPSYKGANIRDEGVVFNLVRRRSHREGYSYAALSEAFIMEYIDFISDPYSYLCNRFFEKQWDVKYSELIFSDLDGIEAVLKGIKSPRKDYKKLVKYKPDPADADQNTYEIYLDNPEAVPKSVDYFLQAARGILAFTKPDSLNDPFDCDCDISLLEIFPLIMYGAIAGARYRGTKSPTLISKNKIITWWGKRGVEEANNDLLDILSDTKFCAREARDRESNLNRILKETIANLYSEYDRIISDEKIESIIDGIRTMIEFFERLKNKFRVLSMATNPKDILMWGYYGNGGAGICLSHDVGDINDGIQKCDIPNTICIYGKIDYKDKQPKFEFGSYKGSVDVFEYIIRCVFTKYRVWENEGEFRYVLMGREVEDKKAVCIESKLNHRFMGVKYEDVDFYSGIDNYKDKKKRWPDDNKNVTYLKKDLHEYKLVDSNSPKGKTIGE